MKKKSTFLQVAGLILLPLLILCNLSNLLFTVDLTIEQLGSAWGDGTRMELMVLWPWMIELICAPVVIVGAVYLAMHLRRSSRRGLLVANVLLYALLVAQYILTNLFIFC